MKKQKNQIIAEFRIEDLLGIGFTIIVLAIGLAYGLNVMGDVRDDMTADTAEYNATLQGITAVGKIPAKLGLIVTVVIAAVIIGILVTYLWIKFK